MAYVDIGDYRYTGIQNGKAQVRVIKTNKTSYEDNILSQVDIEGQTYTVTGMSNCFYGCRQFNQTITIPDSVTNMSYCFYNCINFNQPITIPDSVTNMNSCFRGCISFNQPITISENVTNMNYCFDGCTNFNQTIAIPESVTTMYWCFRNCANFNQPIVIPDSVTDMGYCFYNCTIFNQPITISNGVESMLHCFDGCTIFNQPIVIPDSVTDMGYCFYNCINFNQPITIPDSVTNMTHCFFGCANFNQSIIIPDSVTNMGSCFRNCFALTNNITIKGSPTSIGNIFYNTSKPIYIINKADSSIKDQVASYWRQIASQYPNVHYELDDHTAPLIKLTVKRANNNGRPDSTGEYILVEKNNTIYQDFIPYGYEPATEHSERIEINGEIATPVPENPKLYLLNSETYAQKQIVTYTLNDKYGEAATTLIVSRLMALLDFQGYGGKYYDDEPGMGMAIGKIAERNGLEIKFPTAIGTGLTPATKFKYDEVENPTGNPSEQGWYEEVSEEEYVLTEDTTVISGKTYYTQREGSEYVDLENAQLIVGNYNVPVPESVFTIGNGTENEHSNSFWIRPNGTLMFRNSNYANGVGAINAGLTFLDKNNQSLGFVKAYAEEYNNKLYEGMTFGAHSKNQYNTLRLLRSSDGEYYVSLNGIARNTGVSSNVGVAWRTALGIMPSSITMTTIDDTTITIMS